MNKKLKILHLSSELSWRGGEQQIAYLVKETRLAGIRSQVVCRTDSKVAVWCRKESIPSFQISFKSALNILDAIRIKKYCEKHQCDILHLHTSKSHTLGVIAAIMGLKAPIILTRRVDVGIKKNWFSRFKYNFSQIEKIVCVSNEVKKITSPLIKDKEKLLTIYSGVKINRDIDAVSKSIYKTFGIPEDRKLIGNTSALEEHKDYNTFIDTAQLLIDHDTRFHFIIFGEGSLKSEIQKRIVHQGLEPYFTLAGFNDNVHEFLPQLDYFLMTSKTEGLGTSILDAFVSGVPVIATAGGGIPQIVINRKTGMLSEIGDAKDLCSSIITLEKDYSLKRRIVEEAKSFVKGFSKEKCAADYMKLYQSILNDKVDRG